MSGALPDDGTPASQQDVEVVEVDLTEETSPTGRVYRFETRDLERARDSVRAALALGFGVLLSVMVITSLVIVASNDNATKLEPLKEILQLTFTPVVGLVGSAVGFYFGTRANEATGA